MDGHWTQSATAEGEVTTGGRCTMPLETRRQRERTADCGRGGWVGGRPSYTDTHSLTCESRLWQALREREDSRGAPGALPNLRNHYISQRSLKKVSLPNPALFTLGHTCPPSFAVTFSRGMLTGPPCTEIQDGRREESACLRPMVCSTEIVLLDPLQR